MYGSVLILFYCLMMSSSMVVVNFLERTLNPISVLFYTFSLSFIILFFFNFKEYKTLRHKIRKHFLLIIYLNITTALTWLLEFLALSKISGAISNGFIFGTLPLAIAIFNILTRKYKRVISFDLLTPVLISIILFLIAAIRIHNATFEQQEIQISIGILLAFLSGVFGAGTIILSKKAYKVEFSTASAVQIRFPVLIILSLIYLIFHPALFTLNKFDYVKLIILSLTTVVLPLLILQMGIERTKLITVSLIISVIPVLTFFLQLFEPKHYYNAIEFSMIIILCLLIALNVTIKYKKDML